MKCTLQCKHINNCTHTQVEPLLGVELSQLAGRGTGYDVTVVNHEGSSLLQPA
jgi:hypothetical protein